MKKGIVLGIVMLLISCSTIKVPPQGVNYESKLYNAENVDFHYDLTYLDKDGNIAYDKNIWDATYKLIDDANDFLIIEMFLYNDIYDRSSGRFPEFAKEYTERLLAKQKANPNLKVYVLLDENNNLYGANEHPFITEMKNVGINVIIVDIYKLKDTFPWYSPVWRTAIEPLGNPKDKGWITNFYGKDYTKLSLRNILRALNVKADHRKIFMNEKNVIVSSANIHDPSYFHENVALETDGKILEEIFANLNEVAEFSKEKIDLDLAGKIKDNNIENSDYKVQYITEAKIGEALDVDIDSLNSGDSVEMGMYFLADHSVIDKLIKASNRGVDIKIIFDRSKDAFGMSTNGVPNKPVAKKLLSETKNKIQVKWYFTNGEQYHTKFLKIEKTNGDVIMNAGSANFIKKNIRGYIMDANLRVETNKNSELNKQVNNYFNRLWNNEDGLFTINYEDEPTTSQFRDFTFKIVDALQLGSF
jgi:phosphatidylserine/phosphatidylglycerophosphate/cardiolipin synthase-like enzyme